MPQSQAILLADDDPDDRELLQEAFLQSDDSLKMLVASSGKETVELLQACEEGDLPCLIILDYNMPDLNAAEVLDKICGKGRYDAIPKIVWSTSDAALYQQVCKEKGATHYFQKPHSFLEIVELAKTMLQLCDGRETKSEKSG